MIRCANNVSSSLRRFSSLNRALVVSSKYSISQFHTSVHVHAFNNAKMTRESFWSRQSFSSSTSKSKPSLAQLVKTLREQTGAPMVECKKALSSTSEDVNIEVEEHLEKAIQWLRKHGSAKVSNKMKAGGREAMEGLVGLIVDSNEDDDSSGNDVATMIKIGSETDFASRSDVFAKLVEDLAFAALKIEKTDSNSNESSFMVDVNDESSFWNTSIESNETSEKTVKHAMEEAILSIRENLQLKEVLCMKPSVDGNAKIVLAGYVHGKTTHSQHAGTAAALVELAIKNNSDTVLTKSQAQDIGKKLAMHIVAAKPSYLSPDRVPVDILEKEKEVITEQVCASKQYPFLCLTSYFYDQDSFRCLLCHLFAFYIL